MISAVDIRQAGKVVRNARDRFLNPGELVTTANTPYQVLYDTGLVKLRYYAPSPDAGIPARVPLVIVPPLAVNMLVYDLLPERSFIRYLTGRGLPVYLIDWGSPGREHAHYTLSEYVKRQMPACIAKVRAHSGEQDISLQGWSMGGGLCLAYTAYHRDAHVRNIVTTGTAIDGHANGVMGRQYKQIATWLKRFKLSPRKIPAASAYTPGWMNVVGFKLSDPVNSLRGYKDLLVNLHDRQYVAQHATQSAFIDNLEAYPGGVIRDWMASVWIENEVSKGYLTLGRERADIAGITANLLCIAGANDNLSNVACCRPLLDIVASQDKTFYLAPGGHTGIMSGSQAPDTAWETTAEWLLSRSV